jgi:hypothetical protein
MLVGRQLECRLYLSLAQQVHEFCAYTTHGREGPVEPFEHEIVSATSCLSLAS